MKIRTLLVALVLFVGLSSVSFAGMNRQRRAGAGLTAAQPNSAETCINEGAQVQRRNGQKSNGQGLRQRNGHGRNRQVGNGQGRNRQNGSGQGRFAQGGNGRGRNGQNGNGRGRNGQGGNGQHGRGQGMNRQECNCDGTCVNQ